MGSGDGERGWSRQVGTWLIPACMLAVTLGIGGLGYERTRESPWTRADWGTPLAEAATLLDERFIRGCAAPAADRSCSDPGQTPVLSLRDRRFLGITWDAIQMVFKDGALSEVVLTTHERSEALRARLEHAYGTPRPDTVENLPVLWFKDTADGAWAMIYEPSPTPQQVIFVPIAQ